MHKPSDIVLESKPPQLEDVDFSKARYEDKDTYERELKDVQQQLLCLQQALFHQQQRAIVVFQGWDASGKGGAIRRLTQPLDPRGFHVYPIGPPTADERSRHYLYRFQSRLPAGGSMAIFDRSWYERVLVERVEKLIPDATWERAYQEMNEFERTLTDDGVRIVKIFLHITPEEQLKRFSERLNNPVKQWKLTPDDIRNRELWPQYHEAINDMLRYTSTEASPWHVIPGDKKWYARVAVLKTVFQTLSAGLDLTPPPLDAELIRLAEEDLGLRIKQ
ncbi:MAG: polyphosphate kinase [Oceanospirillaceae bacterium]|nr:polyphosphate kinase [Oceanospirillaceae bacterium]